MKKILICALVLFTTIAYSQPKTGTILFKQSFTGTRTADSSLTGFVVPTGNSGYNSWTWSSGGYVYPGKGAISGVAPDTTNGFAGIFCNTGIANTYRHLRIYVIISQAMQSTINWNVNLALFGRCSSTSVTGSKEGLVMGYPASVGQGYFYWDRTTWGNIYTYNGASSQNTVDGTGIYNRTVSYGAGDTLSWCIDSVKTDVDSSYAFISRAGSWYQLFGMTDTAYTASAGARISPATSYFGIVSRLQSPANQIRISEFGIMNTASTTTDVTPPTQGTISVSGICRGAGDSANVSITCTDPSGVQQIRSCISGVSGSGYLTGATLTSRDTVNGTTSPLTLTTKKYKFSTAGTYYDTVIAKDNATAHSADTTVQSIVITATSNPTAVISSDTTSTTNIDSTKDVTISSRAYVGCGSLKTAALHIQHGISGTDSVIQTWNIGSASDTTVISTARRWTPVGDTIYRHFVWTTDSSVRSTDSTVKRNFRVYPVSSTSMWCDVYYSTWAIGAALPEQINWSGITHMIHFSAEPKLTPPYLNVIGPGPDSTFMEGGTSATNIVGRLIASGHAAGKKVILSLGGEYGTNSTNMTTLNSGVTAADSARVDSFAQASVAYAFRRGYDGVEVDWEIGTTAQMTSRLYRRLRHWLDIYYTSSHGWLIIAAANNDTYNPFTKFYDTQEIINDVDHVNVMHYDMIPAVIGLGSYSGFNAPLHNCGPEYPLLYQYGWNYDPGKGSTSQAGVKYWNSLGMPMSKMAWGIPLYARYFTGCTAPNQTYTGGNFFHPYDYLLTALSDPGLTYHFDTLARTPWLGGTATIPIPPSGQYAGSVYTAGTRVFITFDNVQTITEKIQDAKALGMGGVMFYEYWDGWSTVSTPHDVLLRVADTVLNQGGVSQQIPAKVVLSSPANLATSVPPAGQVFTWGAANYAGTYTWQIASDTSFANILPNGAVSGLAPTTLTLPGNVTLANNTKYYWRVNAVNGTGTGNWSTAFSFTTGGSSADSSYPVQVTIVSPANSTSNQAYPVVFKWNRATYASTYVLKYGTGADTTAYTTVSGIADTQYIVTTGLGASATYNWFIRAYNTKGYGPKSSTYSFTMSSNTAPPIPWGTFYMKDPRNGKEVWIKVYITISGTTINMVGERPDKSTFVIQ